jgi:ABC-2 type transport system permease protein
MTTATEAVPAPGSLPLGHSGLGEQVYALGRRALLRILRRPVQLIFPFAFPMILFAVNAAGLQAATRLPGFPTDDYRNFALAVPFMQGALFISMTAGTDLARDIETGFLNRLRLTPLRAPALLAGQLGGAIAVGIAQGIAYLMVGIAIGVPIESGVLGALVLLALSTLIGCAFAGIGAVLALRFGTGEAVQGMFPLLFVSVFLSSSSMPRNLIQTHWFQTVATYNPVSYLIEGIRSLIITGWDARALALGFGFAAGLTALSLWAASRALRKRVGTG